MKAASPLWFAAECIRWLYVTDKPEKQHKNTLARQETKEVRRMLVDRIKSCARDGDPLFDPDIPQKKLLLVEWSLAEGRDPAQTHFMDIFEKKPNEIGRFLYAHAPQALEGRNTLPQFSEATAGILKNIKFIIDLDIMAEFIRKHCSGDFDNPQSCRWDIDKTKPTEQRLAEEFMGLYNEWKKNNQLADTENKDVH